MACSGNSSELCGGSDRLSVYNLTTYIPPTTVKAVGAYVQQGCYNELKGGRLLTGPTYTNATGMTVESCVNYCEAASQTFAGVEYAQECYCGNSLGANPTTVATANCNMLCTGNNREFCGASNLLNIYQNTPSAVTAGVPASINSLNKATVHANSTGPAKILKREEMGVKLRYKRTGKK